MLKNQVLNKDLEKNGYIVVDFLSEDELIQLNQFYNELHGETGPPEFIDKIHMTTWCSNSEYKNKVATFLKTFFDEPTKRFFEKHRRLNHVFIVKKTGQDTTFKVHQDWNVIDETKYKSVNVWIPLHDVDSSSGALWILPGSHKINRPVRGSGYLFPDYSPFFNELEKASISVKLKAGQAVIFYHSVIHGSPPNLGEQDRKAVCFAVIPENAPLHIHYQPEKDMPLEIYEPEDDFMYKYTHLRTETLRNPPGKQPLLIKKSYVNQKIDFSEIKPMFKNKSNFLKRLFN